jgi:hypothetical protein
MENNDLPLTVVENEDGTFSFDWDENHPVTSMLNDWDGDDFLEAIRLGLTEIKLDMEDRSWRTDFTVVEFEENFDELFERVENGETLTIIGEDGHRVFMLPINQYNECLTGSTQKNDSNSEQTA